MGVVILKVVSHGSSLIPLFTPMPSDGQRTRRPEFGATRSLSWVLEVARALVRLGPGAVILVFLRKGANSYWGLLCVRRFTGILSNALKCYAISQMRNAFPVVSLSPLMTLLT